MKKTINKLTVARLSKIVKFLPEFLVGLRFIALSALYCHYCYEKIMLTECFGIYSFFKVLSQIRFHNAN